MNVRVRSNKVGEGGKVIHLKFSFRFGSWLAIFDGNKGNFAKVGNEIVVHLPGSCMLGGRTLVCKEQGPMLMLNASLGSLISQVIPFG